MHIPTFKVPTIRQVWQLIQEGDYAFSIDLKDAYLHMAFVKHHHHICIIVWQNKPYQCRVFPPELATAPRIFLLLNLYCFLLALRLLYYRYIVYILVLIHSKCLCNRAYYLLCCFLAPLWEKIIFQGLKSTLFQVIVF